MTETIHKIRVNEAIVVEGRDDTINLKRAVDGMTIETHGFGIRRETWELIEKAYNEKGIIVFTDPDFSGEEIRRKLTERFPDAKQAFLTRSEATRKGDIGVENAAPEAIIEALRKAHATEARVETLFSEADLFEAGLAGRPDAREKREKLGKTLGIGYGNSKKLLTKLNSFNITKEEFYGALQAIDN